jgi:lipoprotein-releasing system ATP-binding protein
VADELLLELKDVTKQYLPGPDLPPVPVLNGVTLSVRTGESLAIIGPSGSGKSTLLNIIGALDTPSSGSVRFEGMELASQTEAELALFRNQRVGFVFQSHHLLPQCNVLENVLIPTLARPARASRAGAEARGRRLLAQVGLESRVGHLPGQLSGGERQRVAVVRALINEPALLLADEPTGALDRASAQALGDLLLQFNRELTITLIVVTHTLELAGRMERSWELRDGQLKPANKTENEP